MTDSPLPTLSTEVAPSDAPPDAPPTRPHRPGRWPRRERWALTGLLTLAAVPAVAGGLRVVELATGAAVTAADERFVTAPLPVVVHVLTATPCLVLGAFQLAPTYRRWHPRRHRMTGRALVPAGVLAALSGLWMAFAYAIPAPSGAALAGVRGVVGVAMVAFLVLGVRAIVRGDVRHHRGWMIRAYALGAGAGTQVLTGIPFVVVGVAPTEASWTAAVEGPAVGPRPGPS